MKERQLLSANSEESNSETVKLPLFSGSPVEEKCGGKNMSKFPFSAMSLDISVSPLVARRSTYSETHPSKPKENVASPRQERTCQVESASSEIVPSIAQAASMDSYLKSSEVELSAHFRKIRSVLPESIILAPSKFKYLETIQRQAQRKYERQDKKLLK